MSAAVNEFIVVVQRGLAHLLDLRVVLDHVPVGDHLSDVLLGPGLTRHFLLLKLQLSSELVTLVCMNYFSELI